MAFGTVCHVHFSTSPVLKLVRSARNASLHATPAVSKFVGNSAGSKTIRLNLILKFKVEILKVCMV